MGVAKAFIILAALLVPAALLAADCKEDSPLVITAPRAGAHTFNTAIAFRGFSCETTHLIMVRNETTRETFFADTDVWCEKDACVYRFATFIQNLVEGVNDLKVSIVGQDPHRGLSIRVVRTALVSN